MSDAVKVEPMQADKSNSRIVDVNTGATTVMIDTAATVCSWNGVEFPDGAAVECGGERYECSFGQWVRLD